MKTSYIGIGSNMGDRRRNCLEAVDRVDRAGACNIISISSLYITEPVGVTGQEWFVNCAACLETRLSPADLMGMLLDIEAEMGRVRKYKWGPRVIDLDILIFGQDVVNEKDLTIPHPMMHQRRFVMAPMAELAPDLIHPILGRTMTELYRDIPKGDQTVKRLKGY